MSNLPAPQMQQPEDDEIDLGQLVTRLWAGKGLIFLSMVLFSMIGVAYVLITPPTYQADSLLQLEEKSGQLALPDALAGLAGETPKSVAEIEIARSRMVLGQAVADLKLDWQAEPRLAPLIGHALQHYALPIPEIGLLEPYARTEERIRLDLLESPPEWVGKEIDVISNGDGGYVATLPDGRQIDGQVGQTLRVAEAKFALKIGELVGKQGRSFIISQRSESSAIASLRDNLNVSEKGRQSGILELRFTDQNPERAQQILGAISGSYLRQNVARSAAEAESSLGFIADQLPEAERAVTEAEAALNQYRQAQQSVDLALEAQSLLTQVTRLESEIEATKLKEDEVSQRYKSNHPVYQVLLNNRAILENRLAELRTEVDALPKTQREIINLTRVLEVAQTVYTQLLNRRQELQVLRASNIGNVRIIDSARTGQNAIAPRKSTILALSLVLGTLFGIGLVLLRHWMRRGVQGVDELEQLSLSVFATVNLAPPSKNMGRKGDLPIHALTHPDDLTTEAFRSLRTSLHFGMLDAKTGSIALTSTAPDAGKSFTAVNLAVVAAQSGQTVCIMDADLRRGHLRQYFGVAKNQPGLSEVISGEATLDDVLVEGPVPGLMFLPSGRYPPNPSELLMRSEFSTVINTLDSWFDLTICDTPPVLAVTDPVIIGRAVGATIGIIRYAETPIAEVIAMRRTLDAAGVRLNGVILNGFDPRRARGQGGYSYGYSYRYDYKSRSDETV
ncbi:polysaccharide biosynthesis tyrosine autokinase [Pseudorhodobacter ferrugineus]|uniref:polysaccharide biosynthesis tyrosine autokinase n=1 Tax=Pseudorhodobacter ferrugineus TaxID=77008 RepID=UPI0003B64780|nr:polysaccharide biosynthesis tyrosine autokinase [Pseudorhodobacter ferrugineus]